MSLYIRDSAVDELAKKVQKITNAPSKTEAVRRALENELQRTKESIPLRDRVKFIQDEFATILGAQPEPFDMKKFSDELYEDD
ncbi:type II toxin-antitoxin system VapB family antitoxin [Brucella anthropi]|uniref:type II toxin-antitoxin system VapB family antitoxin n=1 Tax=Brucella anthropi TaxID=529 RepID=UPI00235FAB5A|nr:type II toxin-antitoxin system VapB family antitoxin [Brucella anthropi]